MKEKQIRDKAVEILKSQGWFCWWSPKAKWQETDVFGIGDILCSRKDSVKLIQVTTTSNLSARRKKIKKVLENMELGCLIEIWAYNKQKGKFKIEREN